MECPGTARILTAIAINGVKGIPADDNALYGLAMLEYPWYRQYLATRSILYPKPR